MQKKKSLNYKLLARIIIDAILLGLVLCNLIQLTLAASLFLVIKHSAAVVLVLFSAYLINREK